MSEYIKVNTECLVNLEGEHISIYIPKNEIDRYNEIARRAYESGERFRVALQNGSKNS